MSSDVAKSRGESSVGPDRATTSRKEQSVPKPPELEAVALGEVFSHMVTIIRSSRSTLVMGTGRVGDDELKQKVLLPFVDIRFRGHSLEGAASDEDDEGEIGELFTATLPIENMAYLALKLTRDIRRISSDMIEIGQGGIPLEATRIAYVRYYLAHIERQARLCRKQIDRRFGEPEAKED